MKISIVTEEPFDISQRQLQIYSIEELENTLTAFNYTEGRNYYFLDYYREKIIVDSPSSLILCGFPKELVDEEGFGFFQHLLPDDEWQWMNHVNEKMYQFFFSCSKSDRKNLVLSYDFKMVTLKDRQVILSHTIVPYKLCKNSNLWIALCHVSLSPNQEAMHPTLHNRKTGKQYNLINNDFVEVDSTILSSDERMILEWMIKGLSDIAIGERLNIPSTSFKRKKRIMYDKLGANSSSEATYKAHLRGII